MGRYHVNTLQLNTRVSALIFLVALKAGSLWDRYKAGWFSGWVLASTEGHAESCNVDESNKRFVLGRRAKGITHRLI